MSGQTVASLMAVLGLDTTAFERGTKKVKAEFGSIAPKIETVGKGIAGFVAQNATLISGVAAVGAGAVQAYKSFQSYAGSVRDVARASGSTATEASKLIQVMDDYELSAGDVLAATKAMTKQGFEPSIETIAKLSDQYLAINDPMQRNEFLLKNLGKAGLQWSNVLMQGGDALKQQSNEVNKNLILTDEQIKKAEQARLAVDTLSDSWEGIKVSVGGAIGNMIAAADTTDKLTKTAYEYGIVHQGMNDRMKSNAFENFSNQMEKGAAMTEYGKRMFDALNPSLVKVTKTAEELTAESQNYMSVLGTVSNETQNFTDKNQELNDKLAELQAKQAGMSSWTQGYKDVGSEIEVTKSAISSLAEEHDKASQRIIFDLISQQAAATGYKDISVEALAQIGEQWGVLAAGSGKATSEAISQAEAWSSALAGPVGQVQTLAAMWANLAAMAKTGIKLTATVVSQATGGAMGGSNGDGLCFTGDTLITMSDGKLKPIKDIVIGDKVLSYDLENNFQINTEVIETFEHPANEPGRLLSINENLKVTEEHLLWNGQEWRAAGLFSVGDSLMNKNGTLIKIHSIREIEKNEPVYNIHVNHAVHNYFAGHVLVHNAKGSGLAAGGKLQDGWNLVGDRAGGVFVPGISELVYGDTVFSSKLSEKLIKSGVVGGFRSLAQPNEDTYSNAKPPQSMGIPAGKNPGVKAGSNATNTNATIAQMVQNVSTDSMQVQTQMDNTAAQVQMAVQQMSNQIQESNTQTQNILDRIASIMLSDNPRAVGKQVAYEVSKAS